jgi:hypothetical protein
MTDSNPVSRRDFVKTASSAAMASLVFADSSLVSVAAPAKRRYAIVGTGDRSIGMWGRQLIQDYPDLLEFV